MRKSPQTRFKYDSKSSLSHNSRFFGGSLLVGKRKSKRVIRPKSLYHIVLRSELARGPLSLKRFDRKIKKILSTQSQLHNVIIEDSVNVGNHIHLMIRPLSSYSYKAFIRSITGLIARGVLGA